MQPTHTLVMTGASRGIGHVAARRILAADPGVHLVLLARGDSGQKIAIDLAAMGGCVSAVPSDLASVVSVHHAASGITERLAAGDLPPLRGIVANAGIQHPDALTAGPEGLESTFAVNVVANHVLVRALAAHLAPGSRVTITVSDTHFGDLRHNLGMVPGPVWRSPDVLARPGAFDRPTTGAAGRTAYSTSKLAAIHLVHELARRLPAGVDVMAFNPGFVPGTGLARQAGAAARFVVGRVLPLLTFLPFASSADDAGRHLADVVLGATQAPSGSYVDRATVAPSSGESYDPVREALLWEVLERLTEDLTSPRA